MASEEQNPTFWGHHRFLTLIIIAILITGLLTTISMSMYISSGASQLDLSRPGYSSVQDQVDRENREVQNYSATGPINENTINEFKDLYDEQLERAKVVEAFGGDPLSPKSLGIDAAD